MTRVRDGGAIVGILQSLNPRSNFDPTDATCREYNGELNEGGLTMKWTAMRPAHGEARTHGG